MLRTKQLPLVWNKVNYNMPFDTPGKCAIMVGYRRMH